MTEKMTPQAGGYNPADHDKRCPRAMDSSVRCNCGADPASPTAEAALIERTALEVGMKSLMGNGAASCVYSEGCAGVTQEHLIAFARKVALHCAVHLVGLAPGAAAAAPGQDAEDAARYRFLRDNKLDGEEYDRPYIHAAERDDRAWGYTGEEADAVIDAARAAQQGAKA